MTEKIEEIEKITVKFTYEWQTVESKLEHEIIVRSDTSIVTLFRRFGNKVKMSDLAFFHGDVELSTTKTFTECNIPAGAILTVCQTLAPDVQRKREDSPSPDPGDMQKTPKPSPELKWTAMKASVKEKTSPLPAEERERIQRHSEWCRLPR